MYQLISAIAKPLNGNGRWTEIAAGDIPLSTLFSKYSKIWATLFNQYLTRTVALDVELIRASAGGPDITLNQFLVQSGNATLPTVPNVPVIMPRYAKYADAFHARYKVAPIHPTAAADAQLPLADKTSLHLTRPDTDYDLFHKSCLVNVNGFYHFVDASTDGVYVKDGMRSAFLSRQNQIGIYSFRELGELTCYPITADMVYKQNVRQSYQSRAYVDLKVDLVDKTVMLVLGGYLHVLDPKTFYRVSESAFVVDFANLPLLDRYYESRKYLDLSSLGLESTGRNASQISVANFFSDDVLRSYLTLSQSFFVVLDTPDVFVDMVLVQKSKLPNIYVANSRPEYPLIVGVGKVANYWTTVEDGRYALTCHDTLRQNYLYDTTDVMQDTSVSDSRLPLDPVSNAPAYLLQIGRDL